VTAQTGDPTSADLPANTGNGDRHQDGTSSGHNGGDAGSGGGDLCGDVGASRNDRSNQDDGKHESKLFHFLSDLEWLARELENPSTAATPIAVPNINQDDVLKVVSINWVESLSLVSTTEQTAGPQK
jgi:hypothetical protein